MTGYFVYRGTQSGGPYTKLQSSSQPGTTYVDSTVQSGTTYYYVVTAVDSNGNESADSNQATAVVPTRKKRGLRRVRSPVSKSQLKEAILIYSEIN